MMPVLAMFTLIVQQKHIGTHSDFLMDNFEEEEFCNNNNIEKILPLSTRYPDFLKSKKRKTQRTLYSINYPSDLQRGIAVVGSRDCSNEGKEFAYKLGQKLAESKTVLNSGLARGIDTNAHMGCLEKHGTTYAFLAWFHKLYPPENSILLNRIIENGSVFSHNVFMPKEKQKYEFLKRDEYMALFSNAIVIVETKPVGGAMYTAKYGLKKKIPIIVCDTQTKNPDLINGFKVLADLKAHVISSPEEIIGFVNNQRENPKLNDFFNESSHNSTDGVFQNSVNSDRHTI